MRTVVGLAVVVATLFTGGASVSTAAPRIELKSAYTYLGAFPQQVARPVSLRLRNVGDAMLVIEAVTTDCRCVTAPTSAVVCHPGETATLPIRLETRDFLGRIRREIDIRSNDPKTPVVKAILEFDVVRPLSLEPYAVHLGVRRPGEQVSRALRVRVGDDRPTRLLYAVADDPSLRIELPEQAIVGTDDDDTAVQVTATMPPSCGPFHAAAVLHTDRPDLPKLTVAVVGTVSNAVTIGAPSVDLGRFAKSDAADMKFAIRCQPGTRVKNASLSTRHLELDWEHDEQTTTLRIRPGRRLTLGTLSAVLNVELAGIENHTIQLPVIGTAIDW